MLNSWQAVGLTQEEESVTIEGVFTEVHDGILSVVSPENRQALRAKYVVGTDGANSFIRQALDIDSVDMGFFYDWLILDVIPNQKFDISPQQMQLCDPNRPITIVPGGPGRRRWECMLLPGESSQELMDPESAWKILERFGLNSKNATLERNAIYRFQARWAKKWRKGRCLIAGDAAHLTPPFLGEGMCAGLRDALAIAWRLDLILSGQASDDLLNSYSDERKEHVRQYIEFAVHLGHIICITDPLKAAERDRKMLADRGNLSEKLISADNVQLGKGVWIEGSSSAGMLSIQGIVEVHGKKGRFDEVIGRGWLVIAYSKDPKKALTDEQKAIFSSMKGSMVILGEVNTNCDAVDVNGTYTKWFRDNKVFYVIQRPDFYVAAMASSDEELCYQFDTLIGKLHLYANEK